METSEHEDGWDQRPELEARVREVLATQAAVDALREEHLTFGERAADRLAAVAGSWTFIFTFLGVLALWIALNASAWVDRWDAYPFILLNLLLSILAAVPAPVIMMSQKRDQRATACTARATTDPASSRRSSWSTSRRRSRRSSSYLWSSPRCRDERRVASRQGSSGYELTGRPFTQVHQTCTASEAAAQGLVADAMPTATAKS